MAEKREEWKDLDGTGLKPYHFKTDADIVDIADKNNKITATNVEGALEEVVDKIGILNQNVETHNDDNTKHITVEERTSWNAKQSALGYTPLNKAGDTATGILIAQNNTSYTVAQVRNIIFWDGVSIKPTEQDGTILLTYTP